MPSFPPQPVATPSPPPTHPPFNAPSPIPALSYGCERSFVTDQISPTHSLQLGHSLSPELHGAPTTPSYHPYAQPQVVPNPDDLGYGFFTGAGSSPLPAVHHPPVCEPSYEECEPFPLIYRVRHAYSPSVAQCGVNSPNPTLLTSTRSR